MFDRNSFNPSTNTPAEYMMKFCFALSFLFLILFGLSFNFSSAIVVAFGVCFVFSLATAYVLGVVTFVSEFLDSKHDRI